MAAAPRLLVVHHSRSGGTAALLDAALAGMRDPAVTGLDLVLQPVAEAGPDDVLGAAALVIATPVRFGGLAGLTRDFLERCYYPLLDRSPGFRYGLLVRGTTDASGAVRDVERIVAGLRWRPLLPPLVVERGEAGASSQPPLDEAERATAHEWGATIAALVAEGLT